MNHLFHTSFREMDAFRGRFGSEITELLFWVVLVYGEHLIEYHIVADLKRPRAFGLPNVLGLSQPQLLWIWRVLMEERGAR